MNGVGTTVGQAGHHACHRGSGGDTMHRSSQTQLGNGQSGWLAGGQVSVKGHGEQDPCLHCGEAVDEEPLDHTALKVDLVGAEPEGAQELGRGGSGEHEVGGSQHGEEGKRGNVQAGVHPNHEEECDVPLHCHKVRGAESESDPEPSILGPVRVKDEGVG